MKDKAIVTYSINIKWRCSPDASQICRTPAVHRTPANAVVVKYPPTDSHRENVTGGRAPDTHKLVRRTTGHGTPRSAVVMEDGARVAHNEHIVGGTAPDTPQVHSTSHRRKGPHHP